MVDTLWLIVWFCRVLRVPIGSWMSYKRNIEKRKEKQPVKKENRDS